MKGKREAMTARELARRINVPHTTVMGWLQKGQVPGAKAEEVGQFKVWVVPTEAADTLPQWRPKRGRPAKKEAAKKAAKSGAHNGELIHCPYRFTDNRTPDPSSQNNRGEVLPSA